ncbi:unnamed protein product [Acanthoscelides obtectus]|uniref:beta-galactoside alpha-(2,6)-sialyltransferase n=1 Tax=Acanthoscelides obtectus TaxID=200917 RepID=A0A9P0KZH5_ACAOB|nr:unnamed protein product [Acanthoscelides obtectus]CAK1630425.1 Beta-galactoside alpha-2,6-sialyltransferase 1 [Acanthoscelides obtectus]
MRALVVSIWVFINLVFFGMCGYMYLLWSQYWVSLDAEEKSTTSTYDQQIYFYNRGYYPSDAKNQTVTIPDVKDLLKQSQSLVKDNASSVTLIKNSMPRFPNLQPQNLELGTKKYRCIESDTPNDCDRKTSEFKDNLIKELRRVFTEETNVLKPGNENRYNVQFRGVRGNYMDKTPSQLRCDLLNVPFTTLKRFDVRSHILKDYLPKRGFFENKRFNTCAIVSSAGALKGSNLGKFIDSHDLVLRFNNAPTKGFEEDVGRKTTVRLLNSQVVTKDQFKFLKSNLFKNITIVAWDPSNFTSTLSEWLARPEYNLLPNYIEFKKSNPKAKVYLVNPLDVWRMWEFLQENSPGRLRRNPPLFRIYRHETSARCVQMDRLL